MISANLQYSNAAIGRNAQVLEEIHSTNKNIAIYQRNIEPLMDSISIAVKQPVEFRASGTAQEISSTLEKYFESTENLEEVFLQDVLHLLGVFNQLTKIAAFRLSLVKVSSTMCPRFHADNNQLRMLCTYYGPGTLWLPDEAVDRKAYQTGKTNEGILLDEDVVQQVNKGDVVVLKGSMYPGKTPILHRSLNLDENGQQRLLLTLDTNQPMRFSNSHS